MNSIYIGIPRWLSSKESACQCRRHRRCRFNSCVRKTPWRNKWQPTPIFLLGNSHGQTSLVGYSPWGRQESNMTEHHITHTHITSSSIHLLIGTWVLPCLGLLKIMLLWTLRCMYLFKLVFSFFWYTSKSGTTGSYSSSIFSFWETSMLFSVVAAPIYIPTNRVPGSMIYHLHVSYHGNVESQLYQRTTCNVKWLIPF